MGGPLRDGTTEARIRRKDYVSLVLYGALMKILDSPFVPLFSSLQNNNIQCSLQVDTRCQCPRMSSCWSGKVNAPEGLRNTLSTLSASLGTPVFGHGLGRRLAPQPTSYFVHSGAPWEPA